MAEGTIVEFQKRSFLYKYEIYIKKKMAEGTIVEFQKSDQNTQTKLYLVIYLSHNIY